MSAAPGCWARATTELVVPKSSPIADGKEMVMVGAPCTGKAAFTQKHRAQKIPASLAQGRDPKPQYRG
jgi:hypothetical protein